MKLEARRRTPREIRRAFLAEYRAALPGLFVTSIFGYFLIVSSATMGVEWFQTHRWASLALGVTLAAAFTLATWWAVGRSMAGYEFSLDGDVLTVRGRGRRRYNLRYVEAIQFGRPATRFERLAEGTATLGLSHVPAGFNATMRGGVMIVREVTGQQTTFPDFSKAFDTQSFVEFLTHLKERGVRIDVLLA